MSLARVQTRTARSGVERTNHEATAPPQRKETINYLFFLISIYFELLGAVTAQKLSTDQAQADSLL